MQMHQMLTFSGHGISKTMLRYVDLEREGVHPCGGCLEWEGGVQGLGAF